MVRPFYTLILDCQKITQQQRHPVCELEASIREHIHLILKTHTEEYRYDDAYGCTIWDQDFLNIHSVNKWRTSLEKMILQALTQYEQRLSHLDIRLDLDTSGQEDPALAKKNARLKRRITITVSGKTKETNRPFLHTEHIFFSPLSIA